tara:strand:- start:2526 stop:3038 length:513 start_codon:yes stop_codon:yes gene_type:complete
MPESNTIQIRPRFKLLSDLSIEEIQGKINDHLVKANTTCFGKINHGFGTIQLPKSEQHYWSPQLVISLEKTEGGTEIRGLYGPKPSIWTMFVFFYATIAFGFIITLIIGLTNISMEKESLIIWFAPALLLLFFSLYLISYLGQKKGTPQLVILEKFIEGALGMKMEEHFH